MGAAAKAVSGLGRELTNSGLQSRLTVTPIASFPASLTTPIPATSTQGERMVALISNHTATGTITFTGTAPFSVAAASDTSYTLPINTDNPGEPIIYVTSTIFGAINASGVTISGLTGGQVVVYGMQAANRMIVGEVKLADKWVEHSPVEQRGTYDQDYNLLALATEGEWEWQADFYADEALALFLGGYASDATTTTIPAVPISVLTATSITTSGNASAANQPTAPGMVLICVIASGTTTAQTVSVTGTNIYGETITEVVVPSTKTAGTYVSSNVFATIAANGIVWGAFGGGTLTVTAVFGWSYTNSGPSDNLNSFALENYDSTGSFAAPYCLVNEWTIEGGANKEAKITAKGICQKAFPVGNPATTSNQVTAFSQVLDKPTTGWQALLFIDAVGGTPGTTQCGDLIDWKVTGKIDWVAKHTSWANPPNRLWKVAYRKRRHIEIEVTLDMTTTSFQNEYMARERRSTRYVQLQLLGPFMGASAGTNYYEGATITLPVKWIETSERDYTTGKESVEVKLKGVAKVQPALGYSHKIAWYSHVNAW